MAPFNFEFCLRESWACRIMFPSDIRLVRQQKYQSDQFSSSQASRSIENQYLV